MASPDAAGVAVVVVEHERGHVVVLREVGEQPVRARLGAETGGLGAIGDTNSTLRRSTIDRRTSMLAEGAETYNTPAATVASHGRSGRAC